MLEHGIEQAPSRTIDVRNVLMSQRKALSFLVSLLKYTHTNLRQDTAHALHVEGMHIRIFRSLFLLGVRRDFAARHCCSMNASTEFPFFVFPANTSDWKQKQQAEFICAKPLKLNKRTRRPLPAETPNKTKTCTI